MVFPSDGEYSPLDVGVDLTPSWPLLGILVVVNKLSQAPQPDALSLQDPVG